MQKMIIGNGVQRVNRSGFASACVSDRGRILNGRVGFVYVSGCVCVNRECAIGHPVRMCAPRIITE